MRTVNVHLGQTLVGVALGVALLVGACSPASSPSAAAPTAVPAKPAAQATTAPATQPTAAAKPVAGSPTSAPAAEPAKKPSNTVELAAYKGSDRQAMLEASAKNEGSMTWYTSLAGDIVDRLAEGYKKKYPFMQVDVYRAAENEIMTRATQEAQAGKQVFDVVESPYLTARLLKEAGLVTPFYSPSLGNVPADYKSDAGNGTADSATDRVSYIAFGYNTTLLPESGVPKTIDDLMNPALTGKMAIAGSTTGKRWLGTVLHVKGDKEGRAWLAKFADQQKPTIQQMSGKALLDLVAKGEVTASPTIFRDHVDLLTQDTKAPVKWQPVEPATANVGQVAFATKAPHPNAGLLFVDFLLGPDGEKILHDNGYTTAADKVDYKFWVPEQGKTADQIEKEAEDWNKLFNSTFRQ